MPRGGGARWAWVKRVVKDYWYIIVPVEVVSAVLWYGGLHLAVVSGGADLEHLLARAGASEELLARLREGEVGAHVATLVIYNLLFPVRQVLTLAICWAGIAWVRRHRPTWTTGRAVGGVRRWTK